MVSGGTLATKVGYIPSLNGIRALAVFIVIWGHAALPVLIKGSTGVTIFFFLSGYLITTLLRAEADARGRISVRDFYLRRAFRIVPPLYIVLVTVVLLAMAGVIDATMNGWGLTSSATFWSNYFIIFDGREGLPGGMNALWSLAVEEHYYIVFPLLYIAMRKWLPRRLHQTILLVAFCIAIMVWRIVLERNGASWDRLYLATDTRADAILWGSVLAIAFNPIFGEVKAPKHAWLLTPVLVGSAVTFYAVSRIPDSFGMTVGYTVQSLALIGVFIPLIMAPRSVIGRVFNWAPVAFVGVLSYTVYLIHRPALVIAETWLNLPHSIEVAKAIVASFAFAYAMYRIVEQPMAKLRKRVSNLRERQDAGAVSSEGEGPQRAARVVEDSDRHGLPR